MGSLTNNLNRDICFWLEGFDLSLLVVWNNLSFRLPPHMGDLTVLYASIIAFSWLLSNLGRDSGSVFISISICSSITSPGRVLSLTFIFG